TISLVPSLAAALTPPLNPTHKIVDEQPSFMSVEFLWDKSADPEVEWYHLFYFCVQNCPSNPGDALWVIQPIGPGFVSHLFVGGFDYSTAAADTLYQWRVGACSAQAAGDCAYTALQSFETNKAPPPLVLPPPPDSVSAILQNPISSQTLPQLLENVLNFLFGLSMVILPIIILYGGILLLTAGGDPQKISKSRTILLWAVVAFAIILLARGLPPVLRGLL
ncbi:hypothetical protein IIB97_02260, partial [Patescibacteria group bacterium]|nr:hypothetical protein [Patescibacteria group bacterium]